MLAVQAAEILGIPERAVREGLQKTVWPGRMEEIMPGVYLDGAHNEGGIRAFARAAAFAFRKEENSSFCRLV